MHTPLKKSQTLSKLFAHLNDSFAKNKNKNNRIIRRNFNQKGVQWTLFIVQLLKLATVIKFKSNLEYNLHLNSKKCTNQSKIFYKYFNLKTATTFSSTYPFNQIVFICIFSIDLQSFVTIFFIYLRLLLLLWWFVLGKQKHAGKCAKSAKKTSVTKMQWNGRTRKWDMYRKNGEILFLFNATHCRHRVNTKRAHDLYKKAISIYSWISFHEKSTHNKREQRE